MSAFAGCQKRVHAMNHSLLPLGKLKPDLLEQLLRRYSRTDARVIVGPAVGVDAAVIDMGEIFLVAKTDPITFVADDIGLFAVIINANDIACMGGRPKWFLATLLLPEGGTTFDTVDTIFSQLARACSTLNISLCGGHTEVTCGIDRPLLIGQMLGEVEKGRLVSSADMRVGDSIILTKGVPIEAGAIIARERAEELKSIYSAQFVARCRNLVDDPGISVLADAEIACAVGEVHAMHDPTEGGVATGLWEMARASCVGLEIDLKKIPVLSECKTVCDRYNINPLGAIASGALLIAAPSRSAGAIVEALRGAHIDAAIIGRAVDRENGLTLSSGREVMPLPVFARDEITKIFEKNCDLHR